ncbi:uncharacterized protein LOC109797668 [Cajanus cajan]|uniref:Uncharacterized protein n=1 Tax=Cajanus cajan TaxID=3821 RepID=A0A151TU18_CAJCA|nr:uncharacterized protein LOC109797668 [Cajanus cajan]KYP70550.1 hypothetical protein KK1_009770 [Cajanus cajan]
MEPDNIDWDNIDSTFVQDDTYENFDAPMWVDLSAFDESLVDDEAWFCTHGCKHPKTAEDFLKPTATRNSKAKLLRFPSISEILPFRDRHRRENSSTVESSKAKSRERPSCSGNFYEDSENRNPNFSGPLPSGRTNKLKKPLMKTNGPNPKQLDGPVECGAKSNRKSQLKSTFSAQNLLGGREILSQISGLCSELKRLARGKKGTSEKVASSSGWVSEEVKESMVHKERVPLLVVKKSREGHS